MARTARSITQLQAELDARFPGRVTPDWTLGDQSHAARASDHNPNAADVVCAIDIRGADTARVVWDHLMGTRDGRVKYMIHAGKIVNSTVSPWRIRDYNGSNQHSDHIHISVGRGPDGRSGRPDLYDSTGSWGIDSAASPPPGGGMVLRRGSSGQDVADWQTILVGAGHQLAVDGDFGPVTEKATRAFQATLGVAVDGEVGPETRAATARLLAWVVAAETSDSNKPAERPYPGQVEMGNRGPAVKVWQTVLRERGYRITVDGDFGPATNHVVRDWQSKHGLTVDGIAGPATWHSLLYA